MKKMDKKLKSLIAVYSIFFVLYIVIFLVLPFEKIVASWISFVFTLVAIVGSFAITWYAFAKKETLMSKVYGYPVFRMGVIYLLVQLGTGIIICVLGAFLPIPYWVALLTALIYMGAAAIGVITTDNTRDLVEKTEEQERVDTKRVTLFQLNINSIVQQCENKEVKKDLEKLNEQFRYSDPVSSEATEDIEGEIKVMLEELREATQKASTEEIQNHIRKVSNTLAERNQICKANK